MMSYSLLAVTMMPTFLPCAMGCFVQEKLYVELKNILGRQPGPEVAEQLAMYQENLKHKVQLRPIEVS